MKYLVIFLLFILTSCAQELSPAVRGSADFYDLGAEVERYLLTSNPAVESEILKSVIEKKISNEDIKKILRGKPRPGKYNRGLQTGLKSSFNGKNYSHALYVPKGKMPEEGFPLIIILHGMGGHGNTTLPRWVPRLRDKFVILCPSYPMGAWWSANAENFVIGLIREIQKDYPINQNRIFLSGLSNGAIGAFWIGMNYPDRFAGIIPIAGGITERLMHFLVNLRNTSIYIIHGKQDPIFPVALLRRVNRILKDMKYPLVYREHSETTSAHGGHFMPKSETSPLINWLNKQTRTTMPDVIRMTREGNHLKQIHWASIVKGKNLAALQMPGPEGESVNIQDGKIASLFITRRTQNRFEAAVKNVIDYEIYLNTEMVDFKQPVRVTTQELLEVNGKMIEGKTRISFNRKVEPDPKVLLSGFKKRRDPNLLFDAVIKISTETRYELARQP